MKKLFKNFAKTAQVMTTSTNECENLEIHVNITTTWALALGKAMNLSKKDMEILALAVNFHDLGKAFVWETITSPKTATPEMRATINTHSISGAILAFFKVLKIKKNLIKALKVAKIVLCHHDYITGVGVNGIKVKDVLTHILTIADIIAARCYNDPTRNYKVEMSTPIALANDLLSSANFNKVVLELVPLVNPKVFKTLVKKYNIVDAETEYLLSLI